MRYFILIVVFLFSFSASAQSVCVRNLTNDQFKEYAEEAKEHKVIEFGLQFQETRHMQYEVWRGYDGRSWTLVIRNNKLGKACIVAAGSSKNGWITVFKVQKSKDWL